MDMRMFLPLIFLMISESSSQSLPLSPCPNIFQYEPPGTEQGRWYGVVTLSTDITLYGLWLDIVLDNKADILGNWVGDVTTTDNMKFNIQNSQLKVQPGSALTVRFFVQYSAINKVPKLITIRWNGKEICSASTPVAVALSESLTSRPSYDDRPSRRPDSETSSRPIQNVNRPNLDDTYRPSSESRPNIDETYRPSNVISKPTRPSEDTRPEDKPVTRPVQSRPYPDEQVGGGGISLQSTGTLTGDKNRPQGSSNYPSSRPKPGAEAYPIGGSTDFTDYTDSESPDDYFSGGLPTLNTVVKPSSVANNQEQDTCGRVIRKATPLIVGGKPTFAGQWPWQIALYQTQTVDGKYICGGTLVSRSQVITAAHCVTRTGSSRVVNKNTLTVYLGKYNLRTSVDGVQIVFVRRIIIHPEYNSTSYSKDVGILQLKTPADITEYVRTVCLWPEDKTDISYVIGQIGSVVGWGMNEKGQTSEELSLAEMLVVSHLTCVRSYNSFFGNYATDYTYCAGFRNGTSVCNGDSGGGMVFKLGESWYLRGLVSLAAARQDNNEYKCDTSHYVIFTDLAQLLPWLRSIITQD